MSDPQTSLEPTRTRIRWRWLAVLFALVVGTLVGLVAVRYGRSALELNQALADLDASDPRWRLHDIEDDREDVPEAANGARVVVAAARFVPSNWSGDALDQKLLGRPAEVRLTTAEHAELRAKLDLVKQALEAAAPLPDRPRGRHELRWERVVISTLLKDQTRVIDVSQMLRLAAIRKAQEGAPAEALRWCLGALNVGRSIGDEPIAVTQLVRVRAVNDACRTVERVLAQGVAPEADLKRLQEALLQEDRHDGLLLATRSERGGMYLMFDVLETGEVPVSKLLDLPANWQETYFGPLVRVAVSAERPLYLKLMTRRLEEVRRPMHEQPALERAFAAEVEKVSKRAPVMHGLVLGYTKAGPKFRRKHATVRVLATLLACERYRLARGAWPEKLEQVTPEFLAAIPLDPADGNPLRFTRLPDGVRVHSIGEAGEVGFRLWDADKRAQAPRPAAAEKPE